MVLCMDNRLRVLYNDIYETAYEFILCRNSKNGPWSLYKGNKLVSNEKFIYAEATEPDRVIVMGDSGDPYVIDDNGNIVIYPDSQYIDFSGKYYLVNKIITLPDKRVYYNGYIMDRDGNILKLFMHRELISLGNAIIAGADKFSDCIILNSKLETLAENAKMASLSSGILENNIFIIPVKNKYIVVNGVRNNKLHLLLPDEYDEVTVKQATLILRIGNKYRLFNGTTAQVSDIEYDYIDVYDNYIILKLQEKYSIINKITGKSSGFKYDYVLNVSSSYILVDIDNKKYFIDSNFAIRKQVS